jgi:lipopolysaccharide export system ATP-binding protein
VLDDLRTLFRRRRAPVRTRRPAATDGRSQIDLATMGGPIGQDDGDWLPRSEQRMQQQPQYQPAAETDAQQTAPYAEPEQTASYAEAQQQYYDDVEAELQQRPQAQTYAQPQSYAQTHVQTHAQAHAQENFQENAQASAQANAYVPHAEARAPQRAQLNGGGLRQAAQSQEPQQPRTVHQGYLAAHAVEKTFGNRKVVKGASLYVRRGEAVGLLGPNGAGKTTIFYMITGLIAADKGRVELDSHDVTALPMYQRARLGIGYLPQEASIFRGLNVEENIRAVLEVVEPDKKRRERDLDALLDEFNITKLRKTPSIALSGGERRRCEIARALASRPNYMLLDEPFAGIDPIAVGDIQALVRHLTNRGIGVLITDHNVRETLGLTDRAYIIYSGEVLMEGRTDDIVNNPEVRRLYLGEEFRL